MYASSTAAAHSADTHAYPSIPPHSHGGPHPLRAPRRTMSGWAVVRRGGALRSAKRWAVLRSGSVYVLESPEARSPLVVMPLSGASVTTNPPKLEAVVKSPDGLKVSFTWQTLADFNAFKAAFEFANRNLEDRFKTVSHKLFARRNDSEIVFGFDKATGEHAAIKVLNKDRSQNKTIAESEVAIRMTIDHRAIVKTIDVFETPFDLFIVMYYMDGGSLAHRIHSKNFTHITEHEARVIMARLFSALFYLHERGIVHRNVKPENILLEHQYEPRWSETCRLSDFRMACFLDQEAAPSPEAAAFANQVVGTPDYLAPEAAVMISQPDGSRRPCVGPETDMWAAGVTLYNILSRGEVPFAGATTPEVLRNARHSAVDFSSSAFNTVSESAKSLIRALLNPDRRKRPTADSIMCHPWFDNGQSFVSGRHWTPLVGYHKFRAVATAFRFVSRLCVTTPGFPRIVSSKGMRVVSKVAAVNVVPRMIVSKGVDIPPSGGHSLGTPFHFTTSTLTPSEGVILRTSQTSSAGSFRSSHSSSRAPPVMASREMHLQKTSGGFIGNIIHAIGRRDPSASTSNPASRSHSALAASAESQESTRSHTQRSIPVLREDPSSGDQSMASSTSSRGGCIPHDLDPCMVHTDPMGPYGLCPGDCSQVLYRNANNMGTRNCIESAYSPYYTQNENMQHVSPFGGADEVEINHCAAAPYTSADSLIMRPSLDPTTSRTALTASISPVIGASGSAGAETNVLQLTPGTRQHSKPNAKKMSVGGKMFAVHFNGCGIY